MELTGVLVVVETVRRDPRTHISVLQYVFPSVGLTLKLKVSASTLASSHCLVRGGGWQ